MNFLRKVFRPGVLIPAALFLVAAEAAWLVVAIFHMPTQTRSQAGRSDWDSPYDVPVVPVSASAADLVPPPAAGMPDPDSREYRNWRNARKAEALERRKTVVVGGGDDVMLFPDDDSLTAVFWRRYHCARSMSGGAMTQIEMNIGSDQADLSLEWMLKAMVAELHLLYADDPAFLAALDASQKVWEDFVVKSLALRFPGYPDEIQDFGSSTAMVYHGASIPLVLRRVRELMPWLMGEDCSDGMYGMGSLMSDKEIALRKEALRERGLWPLVPANIGIDPSYGDGFLTDTADENAAGGDGGYEEDETGEALP
jgi:hypothetical protein